ncbi:reverse transcriptase domain-containing protein [Tanacetum coccineum]
MSQNPNEQRTLPEEPPEQHADFSFSLIYGIVSLRSRLTSDKRTRRVPALSEPEYILRCEDLPQQIGAIRGILSQSARALEGHVETPRTKTTPYAREHKKRLVDRGHLSGLRSLLKELKGRELMYLSDTPKLLSRWRDRTRVDGLGVSGKECGVAVPSKHAIGVRGGWFKNSYCKERIGPHWVELRQQHRRKPLMAFKERWIMETGFITGIPEVMKISSFMDAHKCLELGKRYSDKVPKTVDEMMTRLDDFVKSKEAFASAKLPRGEVSDTSQKLAGPAKGPGNAKGRDVGKDKVINMIRAWPNDRKRKSVERDESWMKAPIVFPPLSMEDASDEPLIIEAVMEGYLVRTVYVDQGASMEVMFEHCFENLSPAVRSRLRSTQMDLVGFAGGVVKPLRKIELEVVFGDGDYPDQLVTIGGNLSERCKNQLRTLLKKSMDVFAWEPTDMMGIPRRIIEHSLNASAGIVRPVRYPTWISNPVLVKKNDGSWRMCIDFKNINSACPKDYYPLLDIDGKIESVVGFRYKCFLDAYKGYHQVQMSQDDKEKTAFYTDQGTYCYTKMLFGLKNARATYQRLVDTAFQSQIGRNLEAYMDDMVIKSNDERVLIEDIAEIFDNLRRINMKMNPKKCSFGVEEGKFLGYVITSEGIRANPKKTKCEKGVPRDEKGHSRAVISNYPSKRGNVIRIPDSCNRGRKCRIDSRKKGGTVSDTLRKQDFERSREELCSVRKTSSVIVAHVQEVMKAKYEALLAGLRMARKMKVRNIDVKVDSKLVASQINRSYVANNTNMIKYLAITKECIAEFETFAIQNIPRNLNQKADILSKLATHAFDHLTKKVLVEVLAERSTDQKEVGAIVEEEEDNWMTPIIRCLADGVWPINKDERRALRIKINQYVLEEGVLFKKRYLVPMLRYVGPLQANYIIQEIHMGSCGIHIGARSVVAKAIGQGYYWPTMYRDARNDAFLLSEARLDDSCGDSLDRSCLRWPATVCIQWRQIEDNVTNSRIGNFPPTLTTNGPTHISRQHISAGYMEIGIPTHRTMMIREDENEDELRLNMDLLQERREAAIIREAKYKTKMEQYYNQKIPSQVRERSNFPKNVKMAYAPDESKSQWQSDANNPERKTLWMSLRANGQVTHTARAQDVPDESKSQWPSDAHCPGRKTLPMSPRANGQVTHITRSAIRSG